MIGRTRTTIALLALALLIDCAAPALARAANNCADGGKQQPDEGGIGGTGLQPTAPDEDEGGIGGTGLRGDTGIIGTITGFASICVGGIEIAYSTESTVQLDGHPAGIDQLSVGQVVEVVANGTGSEVSAREISVRHIVTGPVTRSDVERNELEVIGQTVKLLPTARAGGTDPAQVATARDYPLGTFVQISGLRQGDGVIVASRVTRGDGTVAQLTGPVARLDGGRLAVGGTQVSVPPDTQISVGREVRVTGIWHEGQLRSTAIESIPSVPFNGRVNRVDVEGYASFETTSQLKVGPFVFDLPTSAATEALPTVAAGMRIRVQAIVQDRRVVVERIGVLTELPVLPEAKQSGRSGGAREPGGARADQTTIDEHGERPPHDRPDSMPPRPRESGDFERAPRAERPDRPAAPEIPDRPAPIERPPLPDRPPRPDRPGIHRRL